MVTFYRLWKICFRRKPNDSEEHFKKWYKEALNAKWISPYWQIGHRKFLLDIDS